MITEEQLQEAEKTIQQYKNNKLEIQNKIAEERIKKWVGRYFIKGLGAYADKEGFTLFKVLKHDSWNKSSVQVEEWEYAHKDHYHIKLTTWYADEPIHSYKEITSVEFYHYASIFLKKIDAFQAINEEINH